MESTLVSNKLPDWCGTAGIGKIADANDSTFARTTTATMEILRCLLDVVNVPRAAAETPNILRDALA